MVPPPEDFLLLPGLLSVLESVLLQFWLFVLDNPAHFLGIVS